MNKSAYIDRLKSESSRLRAEARERLLGYIVGAFGLIAGLAWNDAVKALIDYIFPASSTHTLLAKFVYAIAITLFVVVVTVYVTSILKKKDPNQSSQ